MQNLTHIHGSEISPKRVWQPPFFIFEKAIYEQKGGTGAHKNAVE